MTVDARAAPLARCFSLLAERGGDENSRGDALGVIPGEKACVGTFSGAVIGPSDGF